MPTTKKTEAIEYDLFSDKGEALDELADYNGDSYVRPETAIGLLAAFKDLFDENGDDFDAAWELKTAVGEIAQFAYNARGMLYVEPHETVVGVSELSAMLAERAGVDPGKGRAIGVARSAREAHDVTCKRLREHYEVEA